MDEIDTEEGKVKLNKVKDVTIQELRKFLAIYRGELSRPHKPFEQL